ncbi:TPA: hypothetical protein I8034_000463 [Legionella pneumophila]|nr:hypothetical protein [Legionella pneumophila subsp. fraseri]HAT1771126.1 hypothetical protein [Legionella pneumophila]MDX1845545.1 hypothetical protein [Legionella pneumophila subsp. fraseri]HAT2135035.1 hypothetical protein [Legionella pneumophila]HAT2141154.1 hypothetical protein [Legionella pneumophila]
MNINEKIELIKKKLKSRDPNAEYEVAITSYKKLYQIKIWKKSSDYFGITKNLIADKNLSEDEFLNLDEKGVDEFIQNIFRDRPKPGPEIR